MTTPISKHARLALLIWLLCTPSAYAAPLFTFIVLPESISGEAGATIGWGYSLTNLSSEPNEWLVFGGVEPPLFENVSMLDSLLFDSPIVAPGATVTVAYNPSQGQGLFQFTWDSAAPVGFVNSGVFTLTPELWDGDPFEGGNPVEVVVESVSAAYSATVVAAPTSVPEPATLMLSGIGFALAGIARRRRGTR